MNILFCDTCALINQPSYIFNIEGKVIIHSITLEELDSKAEKSSSEGKKARDVLNGLFFLWKKGDLSKGVKTENGIICFDFRKPNKELLTFGYDPKKHDNMLLSVFEEIKNENKKTDNKTILVTGDRALALKAGDSEVEYLSKSHNVAADFEPNKKCWKKDTIKKDRRNKQKRRA